MLLDRKLTSERDADSLITVYRCSSPSTKRHILPFLLHVAAAHPKQSIVDALVSALPNLSEAEQLKLDLPASCVLHMFKKAKTVAKQAKPKDKAIERPLLLANLVLPAYKIFESHGDQVARTMTETALRPGRVFVPVYSGASFRQYWRTLREREKTDNVVSALEGHTVAQMQILSPLMRVDIRGEVTEQSWILFKLRDGPLVRELRFNPNYRPYRVTYRHVANVVKFWQSKPGSECSVDLELLHDFYVFMSFWYMLGYAGDKNDCGFDELEALVKVGFKIRDKLEAEKMELAYLHHVARWWGYWSPFAVQAVEEEQQRADENAKDDDCGGEAFFCTDSDSD
jgi:hypothetical protein